MSDYYFTQNGTISYDRKNILIIEDDPDIAAIEQDYLLANNFKCKIASDGLSGLNRAQKGIFDLILLDVILPKMDGFTLCRHLRENLPFLFF